MSYLDGFIVPVLQGAKDQSRTMADRQAGK